MSNLPLTHPQPRNTLTGRGRIVGSHNRTIDPTKKPTRPRRLFQPWIGLAFLISAALAYLIYAAVY